MQSEWNSTTRHIVAVGLTIFGLYILYLSSSILYLVIIAALIAFLLMPIVNFFHQRLKLPRGLAILLAYLIAAVAVLLAPLIFLPPIIDGINFFVNIDYQILLEDTLQWAENWLLYLQSVDLKPLGLNIKLDSVVAPALAYLQDTGSDVTLTLPPAQTIINSFRSALTLTYGVATNVAGRVFSGIITFIVLLLSAIYFSLDAHNFYNRFLEIVPKSQRPEVEVLGRRLNKIWRAYLRGQLNLMLIIGVVTWLGNTALGLPGAFTLGVIAGILELVPNLGPFLAAIPAIIVALIQGSTYLNVSTWVFVLMVIGFYILVQQLENTFIVPRILGEAVDLHPIVVLFGVLVGANVAGILGALLAAPIIASGREIVRYLYLKILGENPYPPGFEETEESSSAWVAQLKHWYVWLRERAARPGASPAPTTPDSPPPGPGDN